MISKTLSTSEKRAALHVAVPHLAEFCQQLYPLLVAHADDFGRLQGDAFTVKHAIDPTSPRAVPDFETGLKALNDVGLIAWYQVAGGRRFIQIQAFELHQIGLHKRTTSVFPEPPGSSGNGGDGAPPVPSLPSELKGRELKRREGNVQISPEPQSDSGHAAAASPMFLEFPVVGAEGQAWRLSEAQVAEWAGLFPTVNVRQEARNALAWVHANPGRKKTGRGMSKFLVGWLTRATDSGRALRPAAPKEPAMTRDARGHEPPCRTHTECTRRLEREIEERRTRTAAL